MVLGDRVSVSFNPFNLFVTQVRATCSMDSAFSHSSIPLLMLNHEVPKLTHTFMTVHMVQHGAGE
jgi:hypothetical protein